jgi:hypothetical protein
LIHDARNIEHKKNSTYSLQKVAILGTKHNMRKFNRFSTKGGHTWNKTQYEEITAI